MTPERWLQVKDIFDRAVECSPASRIAYVRQRCGDDEELRREAESLLASEAQTGSLLDAPEIALRIGVDLPKQGGTRIGPYEILRELGKGGMGFVYLARRADAVYAKLVALKILRSDFASPDLLHRFEQERQILASLDHPNIARLFDGGKTAEGLPYYVMEFIEGQPIDQHCDLQHLDLRSRLALFQQVCSAVDCAHRSGIVHRDLKPSNILVTGDGIVKLLDFGIAKLLQTEPGGATIWLTDAGLRPMTPEYASPEQIKEEELTRATDVYSLGVVLYEILTGRRPYRIRSRVYHEILRVVCEEEPTLPSIAVDLSSDAPCIGPQTDSSAIGRLRQATPGDLRKQLSGDLDSILMKSLRKEPWKRYASASQLGDDVRRHLEGAPVEARSGRYYRLGKRLNQNRGWLLLAIALMAAVATGGIRVSWPTVLIGTAALGIFAICQLGANREVARKVAGGPVWGILRAVVIVTFFVTVLAPPVVIGFVHGLRRVAEERAEHRKGPPPAWRREKQLIQDLFPPRDNDIGANPEYQNVLNITRLIWCVPLGLLFARWIVRVRWGGSLVLDASSRRSKWLGWLIVVGLCYVVCDLGRSLWQSGASSLGRVLLENGSDLLLWVFLYALLGRCEIRQSGLMTATGFYRWPNIASHRWSDARPNHAVLTLNMRGLHPLLPAPKIRVPQPKKHEVEEVMARFLSEWPGGSGK